MTEDKAATSGIFPRWFPSSLRRQLLLGVLAVVSVVLVTVGIVSVLSLRGYVNAMSDADIAESLDAFSHQYTKYRNGEHTSTHPGTPPIGQAMLEFTGQTPGNLIAVLRNGVVIGSAVFSEGEPKPAPADVISALEGQTWSGGPPRTEILGRLGSYRLDSTVDGSDVLVVGMSQNLADRIIARKQITTIALTAGALALTAALTGWVVGHTLNRLLDNVDGALAHRVESDLRMRQFISDASHELRTPLAAIQGYAELTRQDSSELPPTTEYALARIESEARRMALLVDELLLLSRLGEGQDLQSEDVDLAAVANNAVNDATVAALTHHWVKDLPDHPVWVRGDHARLHQLVSNLLGNARVHTPPGVTVTTGITCHRDGPEPPFVELTVTDDGPGIDEELLPRLFERFVRADKSRSDGSGHGLGLPIVSSIVKAHHGSVTVESTEDETVFRVKLPLIDGPPRGVNKP